MLLAPTLNMGPRRHPPHPPADMPHYFGYLVDDQVQQDLGLDELLNGFDMSGPNDLLSTDQNALMTSFFSSVYSGPDGHSLASGNYGEGASLEAGLTEGLNFQDVSNLGIHEQRWEHDVPLRQTQPSHPNVQFHPHLSQPPQEDINAQYLGSTSSREDIEAARILHGRGHSVSLHNNPVQLSPTQGLPVHDASYMFNPNPASTYRNHSRPSLPPSGLQFGTDASFSGNGVHYAPPAGVRNQAEQEVAEQMGALACFQRNPSAANTRAPSPIQWAPETGVGINATPLRLQTTNLAPATVSEESEEPEDSTPRSTKRRKSCKSASADVEDEQLPSSALVAPSVGLSSPENSASPPLQAAFSKRRTSRVDKPAESSGKRKRGATAKPKAPRENLTPDQRRENHIKSEQKRRNLIKIGFDNLQATVPSCKASGQQSKSTILKNTIEWLHEIEKGNELLQQLLDGASNGYTAV
ncbi:hypothetical protein QBC35DRAFT_94627 [Podospora australis]|uniref:BHLH domain-containing protein n=1 Tax=Podospora australis TaxID=1536484 RepID=A0AAN7AIS0_9PEZI|nr:hypothetical protein QBC35DRAFT_94627 [Podospora australis]